ncbi:8777_t:CDS:1, partial [Entrophospora sp. SA101]
TPPNDIFISKLFKRSSLTSINLPSKILISLLFNDFILQSIQLLIAPNISTNSSNSTKLINPPDL